MMNRRELLALIIGGALLRAQSATAADLLGGLSQGEAAGGLKEALERGCGAAVDMLGKDGGFWNNERVRIPLPDWLQKGEKLLRMMGHGSDVDQLHHGVNQAAEQAVPESRELLVGAVHTMSVADAKQIVRGGNDSATRYFESKTRAPLTTRFLPIVSNTTQHLGLAVQYNRLVDRASKIGGINPANSKIEPFVTGKALDGLFLMIGDEERKIRADPIGTGSALIKKVFGGL